MLPAYRSTSQTDAYHCTAEESLRRRRPVAGHHEPGRPGADRGHRRATGRWVLISVPADRGREILLKNQTYNTPAIATLALLAEQIDWLVVTVFGLAQVKRTADSSQRLYSWGARAALHHAICHRPRVAVAGGGHDRLRRRRRAGTVAKILRLTHVDTEPYRNWAETRCGLRCSPRSSRTMLQRLTECVDWVVEWL